MRRTLATLFLAMMVANTFAQTNIPQLVSFSAVVRDQNNNPLVNTPVSLRLTFRQGGQTGPLVYCALHQDVTNANGFISIQLNRSVLGTGCNGAPSTAFENIPWENGGFWMEVEYQTVPNNPFINLGQLELASSFYAFAAGTAERIAGFDLSGAQNGDLLTYNITTQQWEAAPAPTGFSGDYSDLSNTPNLSNVATTGDYNDLSNTPTIPTLPAPSSIPLPGCGNVMYHNGTQWEAVSLLLHLNPVGKNVGLGTCTPDPAARLDITNPFNAITGTPSKGLLIPTLNQLQRDLMEASYNDTLPDGLLIYESDSGFFWYYRYDVPTPANAPYGSWVKLSTSSPSSNLLPSGSTPGNTPFWDGSTWVTNSSNIHNNGTNVGIGVITPTTKLEVAGAATNSLAFNAGNSTSIDLAQSNLAYTSTAATGIALQNIKDGGAYTLVFTSTSATGSVTFSAPGFSFIDMGTIPRTQGKRHIYSLIAIGTEVYVTMATQN